jgi:predicted DNA-binding protein YlxM (UPF0122 family)
LAELRRAEKHYFDDLSIAEIAQNENTSRNAVYLSLKSAKKKRWNMSQRQALTAGIFPCSQCANTIGNRESCLKITIRLRERIILHSQEDSKKSDLITESYAVSRTRRFRPPAPKYALI